MIDSTTENREIYDDHHEALLNNPFFWLKYYRDRIESEISDDLILWYWFIRRLLKSMILFELINDEKYLFGFNMKNKPC